MNNSAKKIVKIGLIGIGVIIMSRFLIGGYGLLSEKASELSSWLTSKIGGMLFDFGGLIDTMTILLVLGLLILMFIIYDAVKNKGTLTFNSVKVVILLTGQFFFMLLYYGVFLDHVIKTTGYNPRSVLAVLTLYLLPLMGIVNFTGFFVFNIKTPMWRGYALISVFGLLLIVGNVWAHPYKLFDHVEYDLPENARIYETSESGEYEIHRVDDSGKIFVKHTGGGATVKPNFWLLKNDDGGVIDVAYSPGISSTYGRELLPGTPEDVEEVMDYENSKPISLNMFNPFVKKTKTISTRGGEKIQKTVTLEPLVGQGETDEDVIKLFYFGNNEEQVAIGDKMVIESAQGAKYYVWEYCDEENKACWKQYSGKAILNNSTGTKGYLAAYAEEGVELTRSIVKKNKI